MLEMIGIIWLPLGIVNFFLLRAAMNMGFSCKPITVGTLIGCICLMWVPPLTLAMALVAYGVWFFEDGPGAGVINRELANPCKWFQKSAE